jgi:hypothetical protein
MADAGKCILQQIPIPFLEPDALGGSEACDGLKKMAQSVQAVLDAVAKVQQMGLARLMELGRQLLGLIGKIFTELLHEGMRLLGEWQAEVEAWLKSIALSALELGKLLGSLIGAILLEWLTAGVGRAIKSARMAKALPSGSLVPNIVPEAVVMESLSTRSMARRGGRGSGPDAMLSELMELFQQVLAKHGDELNQYLRQGTHARLRNNIPVADLDAFRKNRPAIFHFIKTEGKKLRGRIAPYSDNLGKQRPFNKNVTTTHYAEAVADVDASEMDYFELQGRKSAMVPDLLESNHIIEARVFNYARTRFAREWKLLGWDDPEQMASILMPGAEHTRSLRRMWKRYGVSDEDLADMLPDMPDSVTTLQRKFIQLGGKNADPSVLVIGAETQFVDVLTKYEEIYRKHFPTYWKSKDLVPDMFTQFNVWRDKLSLPRIRR